MLQNDVSIIFFDAGSIFTQQSSYGEVINHNKIRAKNRENWNIRTPTLFTIFSTLKFLMKNS